MRRIIFSRATLQRVCQYILNHIIYYEGIKRILLRKKKLSYLTAEIRSCRTSPVIGESNDTLDLSFDDLDDWDFCANRFPELSSSGENFFNISSRFRRRLRFFDFFLDTDFSSSIGGKVNEFEGVCSRGPSTLSWWWSFPGFISPVSCNNFFSVLMWFVCSFNIIIILIVFNSDYCKINSARN